MFQKRLDGSVDFYRGWNDYKHGFGNLNGEFWLGLDKIHRLTKERSKLRVDLEDLDYQTAYAEYDSFVMNRASTSWKVLDNTLVRHNTTVKKQIIMNFHAVVRPVQ